MANLYSAKRAVRSCESSVKSKAGTMNNRVDNSTGWWEGLAGRTFRSKWNEVKKAESKLIKCMSDIENAIGELERSISRADHEREEKRRLELMKRANESM